MGKGGRSRVQTQYYFHYVPKIHDTIRYAFCSDHSDCSVEKRVEGNQNRQGPTESSRVRPGNRSHGAVERRAGLEGDAQGPATDDVWVVDASGVMLHPLWGPRHVAPGFPLLLLPLFLGEFLPLSTCLLWQCCSSWSLSLPRKAKVSIAGKSKKYLYFPIAQVRLVVTYYWLK